MHGGGYLFVLGLALAVSALRPEDAPVQDVNIHRETQKRLAAERGEVCKPGFVFERSTTASAELCQPTCEDPNPKCDKAPAPGCACNKRRPIWMAHHNSCGTLAMCKGVKCDTITCRIDPKTGVTRIEHSTRAGE